MKIGFDISMTHQQKAGCGYVADKLSQALIREYPHNEYLLYDHFITPNDLDYTKLIPCVHENTVYPLRNLTKVAALNYWKEVRQTGHCKPDIDILHANNFQSCKLSSAKLVYTIYDISFWVYPEYSTEANRLNCQQGILSALNNADGLLYISSHARDELHRILPGVVERKGIKECVAHLGAAHYTKKLDSSSDNPRYWLQLGSLEPRKNHSVALDALEIYWERSQLRLPLKIAGGRGWKCDSLLHRIATLEEAGKVLYTDYVTDSVMSQLYSGAMALIFPSWYEGFGLPVLEAMGLGCPVISSGNASLPEVGGDAVAYINPACPEQIASQMLRIEENPAIRQTMVEKGGKQAKLFSWSKTAQKYMTFIMISFMAKK